MAENTIHGICAPSGTNVLGCESQAACPAADGTLTFGTLTIDNATGLTCESRSRAARRSTSARAALLKRRPAASQPAAFGGPQDRLGAIRDAELAVGAVQMTAHRAGRDL